MIEEDFTIIINKIDEEKEFLNSISQEIWKVPELAFEEVHAHKVLTNAFRRRGFKVQEHYFLPTAFKAEFSTKSDEGPTVAVLLEYDALPEIGHACGHNLIAEAGFAAAIAIKAAMEAGPPKRGKLVAFGTPAEESGGGKITLIKAGAFDDIDFAMMVHPARINKVLPSILGIKSAHVEFKGKEAHTSEYPWEGRNALDAAVACYNNLAMLRQQIKPSCRIHAIIKKGGTAPDIIPGESCMELICRAPTVKDLTDLQARVEACITNAAAATGCDAAFNFDKENMFESLLSSELLANTYHTHAERLGMNFTCISNEIASHSTDMGNVSHVVPSIHPLFAINSRSAIHTEGFTEAAGSAAAQEPTLIAAKAMALTAIQIIRWPEALKDIKSEFLNGVQQHRQVYSDILECNFTSTFVMV